MSYLLYLALKARQRVLTTEKEELSALAVKLLTIRHKISEVFRAGGAHGKPAFPDTGPP